MSVLSARLPSTTAGTADGWMFESRAVTATHGPSWNRQTLAMLAISLQRRCGPARSVSSSSAMNVGKSTQNKAHHDDREI